MPRLQATAACAGIVASYGLDTDVEASNAIKHAREIGETALITHGTSIFNVAMSMVRKPDDRVACRAQVLSIEKLFKESGHGAEPLQKFIPTLAKMAVLAKKGQAPVFKV